MILYHSLDHTIAEYPFIAFTFKEILIQILGLALELDGVIILKGQCRTYLITQRLDTLDIEASIEVLLTSANFQSRSFSLSSCSHKLAEKNLCFDMHFTNFTDMHLHVHACINMHFYSIVMCPQLARIML